MAEYQADKKRLRYVSDQEFYGLQASRGADDSKFDVKAKPHIAVDVNRMVRFVKKPHRILDAGCRDAWAMGYLKAKGYKNVRGFDVIKKNVEICRSHGFDVEKADAENLAIYDMNSFDAVLARHMLEHVKEPRKAIHEFARILRPGGIFYCVIPLQKAGTVPDIKYGHSYVFNSVHEVGSMSQKLFSQVSCIKKEQSKSGLAATFVGRRL